MWLINEESLILYFALSLRMWYDEIIYASILLKKEEGSTRYSGSFKFSNLHTLQYLKSNDWETKIEAVFFDAIQLDNLINKSEILIDGNFDYIIITSPKFPPNWNADSRSLNAQKILASYNENFLTDFSKSIKFTGGINNLSIKVNLMKKTNDESDDRDEDITCMCGFRITYYT